MKYDPADIARDLALIHKESADFEIRARLERHLLGVVQSEGLNALTALLVTLPNHHFEESADIPRETARRLVSPGPDAANLVVEASLNQHLATLDICVQPEGEAAPAPDPRHQAFYSIWEELLGASDSELAMLDQAHRTVFLVGLLESEVMNGGLGQYLANTEGAHVEETLACLDRIGAARTGALLVCAAALGAEYASCGEAWDERSADFEQLDNEFMESGEDLAGLTAHVLLNID